MIYGNHNKKKGDIVSIARWDDQALLYAAFQVGVHPQSGPARRAVCEKVAQARFAVVHIDYHHRKVILDEIIKGKPDEGMRVWVDLDETNLIKQGTLK